WFEGRIVHADGPTLFIRSAIEHGDGTVTLPLYRGTSHGRTVWYVVLDASSSNAADRYGVNRAQKLANARGTLAVQKGTVRGGIADFPARAVFSPVRDVVPGPAGFPPQIAEPGAVGESGYSPLIELPDGTILNAPQIANDSGQADKVVVLDTINGSVRYRETDGEQGGRPVRYVSTDASDPAVAALENVTFAPLLNHAPFVGGDGTDSPRASLAALINGQTGGGNPLRQRLNSARLLGIDPISTALCNNS